MYAEHYGVCVCARAHAKAHTHLWVNTVHPPGKSFSFALFFIIYIFSEPLLRQQFPAF